MAQEQALSILLRLLDGQQLDVNQIVDDYGIQTRTAQRLLAAIKNAIEDSQLNKSYHLQSRHRQYRLRQNKHIDERQILVLTKILLASRAVSTKEVQPIINAMVDEFPESSSKVLKDAVANETMKYHEIPSNPDRIDLIWYLQEVIQKRRKIKFNYTYKEISEDPARIAITAQPVAIRYADLYFFLTVFNDETQHFETLRIDWMSNLQLLNEKSEYSLFRQYEPGEKQAEQAYGYDGRDIKIVFEYYGFPDYVLDRFPKSKIIETIEKPNIFDFPVRLMEIEVEYSLGIKMWLMTQSNILRVIEPNFVLDDVKQWLDKANRLYEIDAK